MEMEKTTKKAVGHLDRHDYGTPREIGPIEKREMIRASRIEIMCRNRCRREKHGYTRQYYKWG